MKGRGFRWEMVGAQALDLGPQQQEARVWVAGEAPGPWGNGGWQGATQSFSNGSCLQGLATTQLADLAQTRTLGSR